MSIVFSFVFSILLLLGSASMVFASEVVITDPHSELNRLPHAATSMSFVDSFKCGQPLTFFTRTGLCKVYCDEYGLCEQTCSMPEIVETKIQAEECTADTVSLYTSLGQSILVTANDYQSAAHSMLIPVLKALPLYYEGIQKIEISQVMYPVPRKIIENGQMKNIFTAAVVISVFPDLSKPHSIGLQIDLDLTRFGLDQVMCFSEHGNCGVGQDYIIKRKGLVSGIN